MSRSCHEDIPRWISLCLAVPEYVVNHVQCDITLFMRARIKKKTESTFLFEIYELNITCVCVCVCERVYVCVVSSVCVCVVTFVCLGENVIMLNCASVCVCMCVCVRVSV